MIDVRKVRLLQKIDLLKVNFVITGLKKTILEEKISEGLNSSTGKELHQA